MNETQAPPSSLDTLLRGSRSCPDCAAGLPATPALSSCRDYVSGDLFEVYRCEACGLAWTLPQPASADLPKYYPAEYYGPATARRFPSWVEGAQALLYRGRARSVERQLESGPGKVLDFGCGKGFLLEAFQRRGWMVQGVELSETSARHAREVLGIPVHVGALESLEAEPGSQDALVAWHVLEHLPQPRKALEGFRRLLRPGGVLMISVPNFGSLEARRTGAGWFHLDVPRHLVHFTPETLSALLSRAGFTVVRRRRFAPEFDLFSFIQSLENRLGFPANRLYGLLRGKGAQVGSSASPASGLWAFLVALPLGLLGIPAVLLAGLLGSGSTLTLLARRDPDLSPGEGGSP
ncbi:MAG: class I SAM-dependent methyltransferase [Acidobacteria bacterium]|nr:class I SAM-dependent methyltransferase [Acidobacteriota bacterium]